MQRDIWEELLRIPGDGDPWAAPGADLFFSAAALSLERALQQRLEGAVGTGSSMETTCDTLSSDPNSAHSPFGKATSSHYHDERCT